MRKIEKEVEEYLFYCEKIRGMSHDTMVMKRNVLRRFLGVVKISEMREFSNSWFERWVAGERKRGVKPQSINLYNSVVISMVRYFKNLGVAVPFNLNLVRNLKVKPAARKFYSFSEVYMVVERADFETGLMIAIMFETGMRIAELTRLSTSEIMGRRVNFVGKGGKSREVYMSADTTSGLLRFLKGREGYVWGVDNLNGEPPTVNTVRKRMSAAFLAAGFDGFYPHALRHSFATNLQFKGASVAEIKEMMGHSSIATTERYLHGFEGRMQELFDKYQ